MKKLVLLPLMFFALSCEVSVKKSKAQNYVESHISSGVYAYEEQTIEGMVYGIWYVKSNTHHTGYSTTVVNLTKDSLEVAVLRKQLAK